MRRLISLLCLLVTVVAMAGRADSPAQQAKEVKPAPVAPKPPVPWSTPKDAVAVALLDAQDVPHEALPYVRWVWNPNADVDDYKALSHAVNLISNASVVIRPAVRGIVARIDLRAYAPRAADLERWLRTWEQFEFDPAFSLLIDVRQFTGDREAVRVEVRQKGKLSTVPLSVVKNATVVRATPPLLLQAGIEKLQHATQSNAPIVSLDYFVSRALSTIKDRDGEKDSAWGVIYGGTYYDFAGIRKAANVATDLDQLLFDLGVGSKDEGFRELFDRLRSDERIGIFRSGVTGKPRRVRWFGTPASRLSAASGVFFLTDDIRDRDILADTHPILNLVEFKVAAHEVIWTRANGTQGFALYGGDGKITDEVPPDIASDHTIPSPHTTRLQPAISCIRCHAAGKAAGWLPMRNDVKKLLASDPRQTFGLDADTIDRLAGWYSGNPEQPLSRARDDYSAAAIRATGIWKADAAQTETVRHVSERIAAIWQRARYDEVDAKAAVQMLGVVPEADAAKQLRELLPVPEGVIEDPRIASLKAGIAINYFDFGFIRSIAAERLAVGKPNVAK